MVEALAVGIEDTNLAEAALLDNPRGPSGFDFEGPRVAC